MFQHDPPQRPSHVNVNTLYNPYARTITLRDDFDGLGGSFLKKVWKGFKTTLPVIMTGGLAAPALFFKKGRRFLRKTTEKTPQMALGAASGAAAGFITSGGSFYGAGAGAIGGSIKARTQRGRGFKFNPATTAKWGGIIGGAAGAVTLGARFAGQAAEKAGGWGAWLTGKEAVAPVTGTWGGTAAQAAGGFVPATPGLLTPVIKTVGSVLSSPLTHKLAIQYGLPMAFGPPVSPEEAYVEAEEEIYAEDEAEYKRQLAEQALLGPPPGVSLPPGYIMTEYGPMLLKPVSNTGYPVDADMYYDPYFGGVPETVTAGSFNELTVSPSYSTVPYMNDPYLSSVVGDSARVSSPSLYGVSQVPYATGVLGTKQTYYTEYLDGLSRWPSK